MARRAPCCEALGVVGGQSMDDPSGLQRARAKAITRQPAAMRDYIGRMWSAGVAVDSIARSLATHQAGVAEHLLALADEQLLAGLREHLQMLVAARASKSGKGKHTRESVPA